MLKLVPTLTLILPFIFLSCSKSNEAELKPEEQEISLNSCNTSNMKYSVDIAPILKESCNSCHNSTRAAAGVNTENYNGVKAIAENGSLMGTITHASGFSPMPKRKPKLADCDINKIKAWITQGTKNN